MEVNSLRQVEAKQPDDKGAVGNSPRVLKKRSRKRSIIVFTVVSVLNVALLVLLWTQLTTPARQANTSPTMVGDVSSPLLGKAAPDLVLLKPNSTYGSTQSVAMTQFRGKPVILSFWSSSCLPCNAEAPFLKTNVPKLQAQGVQFVSINAGAESPGDIDAFNQKYGITYPSVQDGVNAQTQVAYGVATIPVTVFIDRNGVIRGMWNVELTDAGLKFELHKIMS